MRPVKRYVPAINPLAKTTYVRRTITRAGEVRRPFFRRPKFRHGIVVGYKP